MNRYAPELALITGGLLGTVFGGFVLFSAREFYSAVIVGVLFCYPFTAYAVHNDDDPTTVLPPRLLTLLSGLLAVGVVIDYIRLFSLSVASLLFGGLLALVVFLPVAAYATRYGEPPAWLTPRRTELSGTLLAVAVLAGGLFGGAPTTGSISAVLVFLAATLFAARSTGVSQRRQQLVPIAGLLLAAGVLAAGVVTGGSLDPWVIAALGAVFGPLLYIAMATSAYK